MAAMDPVDTPGKLRNWLSDKPADWSAAIALRIALRALPIALDPARFKRRAPPSGLSEDLFQALILSWIAVSGNSYNRRAARKSALYSANVVSKASAHTAHIADAAADAIACAAYAVASADAEAYALAGDAAASASAAAFGASTTLEGSREIEGWSDDAEWLLASAKWDRTAWTLTSEPLWLAGTPSGLASIWERSERALLTSLDGSNVWVDWFNRRLQGKVNGFSLSPRGDAEMSRRLVNADSRWWALPPALINAEISTWLAELSLPPFTIPFPQIEVMADRFEELLRDPQSDTAPHFTEDAQGRIAIDPHARANDLLIDARSAARHAAARRRAKAAGELLRGHNQADYLAGYARDVFDALGHDIASGNLAETVLLANRLRQGAAAHAAAGPNDDLQPLPPDIDRPLSDLVDAVNLHIGQQPVLEAMDIAALGPDATVTASPSDMAVVLNDLGLADAIEPRTRDYINVAASLAPEVPDAGNRQSRRFGALTANFGRHVVRWASDNRVDIGAVGAGVVGGAGAIGSGMAAAAVVGLGGGILAGGGALAYGGWQLLCNMKKHPREWMKLAGPSPASRANMTSLLGWLEEHWPSESGKPPPPPTVIASVARQSSAD